MSEYRYAYLGKRPYAMKLHIVHHSDVMDSCLPHGVLCRPEAADYWMPRDMASVNQSDDLWITLVAAHTLCARCRQRFENGPGVLQVTAPPS